LGRMNGLVIVRPCWMAEVSRDDAGAGRLEGR
jgi:hypothetical protein